MAFYAVMIDANTLLLSNVLSNRSSNISAAELSKILVSYDFMTYAIENITKQYDKIRLSSVNNILFSNIPTRSWECNGCQITKYSIIMTEVFNTQYLHYTFCCMCVRIGKCDVCKFRGVIDDKTEPYIHYSCISVELPKLIKCDVCMCLYMMSDKDCPKCNEYKYEKCLICGLYNSPGMERRYPVCECNDTDDSCIACGQKFDMYNQNHIKIHKNDVWIRSNSYYNICDVCKYALGRCVLCGEMGDLTTEFGILCDNRIRVTKHGLTMDYDHKWESRIREYTNIVWQVCARMSDECEDFIRKNTYLRACMCKCLFTDKINPDCKSCTTLNAVDCVLRSLLTRYFCINCIHIDYDRIDYSCSDQ